MITETDIIERLPHVLAGEKAALQNAIKLKLRMSGALSPRDLYDLTYRVRFYLKALHPSSDELVDAWVDQVIVRSSSNGRTIWRARG